MTGVRFVSPASAPVIPAKAGIQDSGSFSGEALWERWTPAFAGVTEVVHD